MYPVQPLYRPLSRARVRLIHEGDLPGNFTPFELSFDALAIRGRLVILLAIGRQCVVAVVLALLMRTKQFLPFEQLVSEPEVRLDNDVEPPSADKAVCSREGHSHGTHHFGDADSGGAGHTNTAVDQSRCSEATATVYETFVSHRVIAVGEGTLEINGAG